MTEKETAEKIFADIDEAIKSCLHSKPIIWNESQFKKLYEEIKDKWKCRKCGK